MQLNKTVPLSYLEGELFQADISCMADHTNGKLMFKFNGTRTLSERGKLQYILINILTCTCTYVPYRGKLGE